MILNIPHSSSSGLAQSFSATKLAHLAHAISPSKVHTRATPAEYSLVSRRTCGVEMTKIAAVATTFNKRSTFSNTSSFVHIYVDILLHIYKGIFNMSTSNFVILLEFEFLTCWEILFVYGIDIVATTTSCCLTYLECCFTFCHTIIFRI